MDNRTLFIIINELTDLLVHEELNKRLYVGSVPVPMDNDNNSESIITHTSSSTNYYPFISGHTEISSGIIHIFRELSKRHPTLPDEGGERVHVYRQFNEEDSSLGVLYEFLDDSVLLVLAIPTTLSPAEFLHFVGSDFVNCIERVRLVRDAAPNRYMAIIKFATPEMALNFSQERDGQAFTAQDPEVCHVVRVASVEFTTRAPVLEPLFDENEFIDEDRNYSYSSLESPNVIEIPTCPVCLERLDSTATGVMIGICNHKYHCQCLSRWGDNSCPVCRYALQGGKGGGRTVCSACDCHEDIWLCLICGVAGCGRYNSGHAHDHYSLTGHCFALELDSHRVWDYVGDNYVHRLIQNKEDGKLVEIPGPQGLDLEDQKDEYEVKPEIDPDYYASLLVAQLESQRTFYEDRLGAMEVNFIERLEKIQKEHKIEARRLSQELWLTRSKVSDQQASFCKDKATLQERLDGLHRERTTLLRELEAERAISRQAVKTTEMYLELIKEKDLEIAAITEQVRDLMVHLETTQKVQLSGELAGGTIYISSNEPQTTPKKSTRRKHR